VLIADDPTAGIDATVRRSVLDVIARMQRERLFSAIVVTADLGEVRRIANRMAVMHRGSIVGIGPVDEVLGDPTHPYVKGLAKALAMGRERIGVD
jgi:ABC-type dipeptide/oligopeptide/nickel transport system ATPase component